MIVCEGRQTEPNYFDGLKRDERVARSFAVRIQPGKGGSRVQIVRQAIDVRNQTRGDFDKVCCVMDVEHSSAEAARRDLLDAINLARENNVSLFLSNPAFEVWFLSHFERTMKAFHDANAVIAALRKHWRHVLLRDYQKNDPEVYTWLADRTQAAIDNARTVLEVDHGQGACCIDSNSSTEIYRLVEMLRS